MRTYRKLTAAEIACLQQQKCTADDWGNVQVAEGFVPDRLDHVCFSGRIRLGVFQEEFTLSGGVKRPSGIRYATLHNVEVGDNCCIENVRNYIANYVIGTHVFIDNVDILLVDGRTCFGNGT